jgi:KUP system potassium uptake protein
VNPPEEHGTRAAAGPDPSERPPLLWTSLVALGIVYGDIGTSPLYAFRESLLGHGARLLPTDTNVLGILSLIFWTLIIVISIKYVLVVMRADNRGEGGIVALVSLLNPRQAKPGTLSYALVGMGLFGSALLYGDGAITPAISVLSAIEGLDLAAPGFEPYVVPITVGILVVLFGVQHRGTAAIGSVFGPIMLIWFLVLAVLGVAGILRAPQVLEALNPLHGYWFFAANGTIGFAVLGAVFLVTTGGEALYADMGHFGRTPIRLTWFAVALPALVLNYFGQGALVLSHSAEISHPFYELAPAWALYPLVLLATAATVIASQALISGVFSLTSQIVQLQLLPRLRIVHTYGEEKGQVYVPSVNWLLMIATIGLVLGFGSSSALAGAYGVAISTLMVITTLLTFFVARRWGWNVWWTSLLAAAFLTVDLAFFGANLLKITEGGWYPLALAGLVSALMWIWRRGRHQVVQELRKRHEPFDALLGELKDTPPLRVDGTAVFMTSGDLAVPPILLHHLRHNQVLHRQVVLLRVDTEEVPRVAAAERLHIEGLGAGLHRLVLRYGFMQTPDIPVALRLCEGLGLVVDLDTTTFYVGRVTLWPRADFGLPHWQDRVFDFMTRNAARATAYYHLPPERVVEIGIQVEI